MRALLLLALVACTKTPPKDGLADGDTSVEDATDADADGFSVAEGDCDDGNGDVHPGAAEQCDGNDQDCDGAIDEDVVSTWYADGDGDGFGDDAVVYTTCEPPPGAVAVGGDCDDQDDDTFPSADEPCDGVDNDCDGDVDEGVSLTWYADADGDGYGDPSVTTVGCDVPAGAVTNALDCDDRDDTAHPDAEEVCDEVDNDCDGTVDDGVATTYWADLDGDGHGNADMPEAACVVPTGYATLNDDCDDTRADVSPDALEACNTIDDDCDGIVDEDDATDAATWYLDVDADGHGDAGAPVRACSVPSGATASSDDCDDARADVSPSGTEMCGGVDEDCDGIVDEATAADAATWYADDDADGYGDAASVTLACVSPAGFVADATDCDDTRAHVSPADVETCDGLDDDCDGVADENDALDASIWYADTDADGHGGRASTRACSPPAGYLATSTDCDDGNAAISPSDPEACNGVDDDCDGSTDEGAAIGAGTWYTDADGDGYGGATSTRACTAPAGTVAVSGDCNDTSSSVSPAGTERCNGIDDDCDGTNDEPSAVDASTWYADADADGHGGATTTRACTAPSGYLATSSDCNDGNAAISPSDPETCNSVDDDCDGATDEAGSSGERTWYRDADGDGYGDASATTSRCAPPAGYVSGAGDCADGDAGRRPGASESCNGVDDDCDGSTDEGFDSDGDGIPSCREVSHTVTITLTVDDIWEGYVDGTYFDTRAGWNIADTYTWTLDSGPHVIAIHGWDTGASIAGFLATTWVDGSMVSRTGDGSWRVAGSLPSGWTAVGYDDSAWGTGTDCGLPGIWGGSPGSITSTGATWIWPRSCYDLGEGAFRLELNLP